MHNTPPCQHLLRGQHIGFRASKLIALMLYQLCAKGQKHATPSDQATLHPPQHICPNLHKRETPRSPFIAMFFDCLMPAPRAVAAKIF